MREWHVKKETVLEKLEGLIADEKAYVDALLTSVEGEIIDAMVALRKSILKGGKGPGAHLGRLEELRCRFAADARDTFPLDDDDYDHIVEGLDGGKERLKELQQQQLHSRRLRGSTGSPEACIRKFCSDMGLPAFPDGLKLAAVVMDGPPPANQEELEAEVEEALQKASVALGKSEMFDKPCVSDTTTEVANEDSDEDSDEDTKVETGNAGITGENNVVQMPPAT